MEYVARSSSSMWTEAYSDCKARVDHLSGLKNNDRRSKLI